MKKILVLAVALMLALSVSAYAAEVDWVLNLDATSGDGLYSAGGMLLGCAGAYGYTDGVDADEIAPDPPSSGMTNVYIVSDLGNNMDFRASQDTATEKVWENKVYYMTNGGPSVVGGIKITVAPNVDFPPVAELMYSFWLNGVQQGVSVLGSAITAPLEFATTAKAGPALYDTFTVKAGPETIIPEPGSLLALGSGLVGLAGFAIRRRR